MALNRGGRARLIGLVALLLVSLALRVIRLERQPLWWDEGNNIYFAHQSLSGLVRETIATRDADPPGYRLALGAWRLAAGSSPFAVRYLSALMALAALALAWVVARWLAGERVAFLTVLLFALSPLSVYYAREAKGYLLATICALLSLYAWGRKLGYLDGRPTGQRRGWWAVYILSAAAGIATHYYLLPLLLWQGLWTVASTRQGGWRPLARWALAMLAAAALLAPWLIVTLRPAIAGAAGLSGHDALTLGQYLWQVLGSWSGGAEPVGRAATLAFALLTILALVGAARSPQSPLLLGGLLAPLLIAYLAQARLSFFNPRFLLYLAPLWYLLAAQGIVALGGKRVWLQGALALGMVALWLPGLRQIYAAPVDPAEDPRPWVEELRRSAQAGDALGYNYIWQIGYLDSYWPEQRLTLYSLRLEPEAAMATMPTALGAHPRFWLLDYGIAPDDPFNLPAQWWDAVGYRLDAWRFGEHYLTLYARPGYETAGVGPELGSAEFAGVVRLRYPLIAATVRAGDYLAFTLEWQALAPLGRNYQVFAHVSAADGAILAQRDSAPGGWLTREWQAGDVITDRRALRVPLEAAPGRYAVTVGLYRLSDGARLAVDGGDVMLLGYVQVE